MRWILTINKIINGFIFDGAENYCHSIEEEAVVAYAAMKTGRDFGVPLHVKRWPEKYDKVDTLAHTMLRRGHALVKPRERSTPTAPRACLLHCVVAIRPAIGLRLPASAWDVKIKKV